MNPWPELFRTITAAVSLLTIAGCQVGGSAGGPTPFPAGCRLDPGSTITFGLDFDQPLPDGPLELVEVGGVRRCAGFQLQSQHLIGRAGVSLVFSDGGVDDRIAVCMPAGRHAANAHAVLRQVPSGDCVAARPSVGTTLNLALDYRAQWTRDFSLGRLCIVRSRTRFDRFDLRNWPADRALENRARDDIHRQVDRSAADQLNQNRAAPGAPQRPLAPDEDARCADWAELTE